MNEDHNIHRRIDNQIHLLLLELEESPERFSFKDRLAAVQIIGMYLTRDVKLRKADEPDTAGSAARKYSGAFKAHGTGGGKARPRPPARIIDTTAAPWDDDSDSAA
jgi:hypothetical protein